jgi:hypothetical protein
MGWLMADPGAGESAVWAGEKLAENKTARTVANNLMEEFEIFIKKNSDLKESPGKRPFEV